MAKSRKFSLNLSLNSPETILTSKHLILASETGPAIPILLRRKI
jgi:hypothetical protein